MKLELFQEKHLQIKSSNIAFMSSMYLTTTNVYLDNLSFKNVDWSFENINLHISSCLLGSAHLKIYKNSWNESNSNFHQNLYVFINDSSLGYLRAENVSQIKIQNSCITGRNALSSSFFVIHNTNVTISNSTFTNNSIKFNSTEPTLLKAWSHSDITFDNCTILGNTGYVSIIQVTDHSSLHLTNCEISYNRIFNESTLRHCIVNITKSFVSAVNCVFAHNELIPPTNEGSVMLISFNSGTLFESCSFTHNQGSTVAAYALKGGKLNVTNCHFAENNCTEINWTTFGALLGHPVFSHSSSIIYYLLNCTFVRNYAYDGGGVNAVGTVIYFKKCTFRENKAFSAGAVTIQPSIAYFENCNFLANKAILQVGGIYVQQYSTIITINCLFEDNLGGALTIQGPSELKVMKTNFTNNFCETRAGGILLEQGVKGNISDSIFNNNSAVHHGCIDANSNVTLQISRTLFVNNNAKDAVVYGEDNVILNILLSKFYHNVGGNCIEVHHNSSLIITKSTFSDNAISPGSVIYVDLNSNFFARNSTFLNHSTQLRGAVIYGLQNSNINLVESIISHNQAKFGGAIYTANCTLHIVDTILDSNKAIDGGVLYAVFSSVHINKSLCINNSAETYGGCMYIVTSNVSFIFSDVSFNNGYSGGAVMFLSNSDFSAVKTKFYNNTAVTNGGVIYQRRCGHMALDQCSFRHNSVNSTFGIYGSDIEIIEAHDLRVSQSEFVHTATDTCTAISFNRWEGNFSVTLITLKTNISYGLKSLSSTDPSFLCKAAKLYWMYVNGGGNPVDIVVKHNETNYASRKCIC